MSAATKELSCTVLLATANFSFYTVKSCRCLTAHIGKQRAVWKRWTGLLNRPKLL